MKHILFLTWKDISHPRAGGAERVIMEYARRLVADGYRVTWLWSSFVGAPETEMIDWVHIIRKYSINTIYFLAWKWYKEFTKTNPVDIIIDEAGGIPLLSPLYAKKTPIYFFIHHIGELEYEKAFPFPINKLFKHFVYAAFSLYKHLPTITVSHSTATELREQHGFTHISVVENATHLTPISTINWENKKREIVFYGRLTRMKRPDHAIRAFHILTKDYHDYHMNIIGNAQDAEYLEELKILVHALGLDERVHFLWYCQEIVSQHLPEAEIMLVPSTKEGYGLVVLEANTFGLPVIAYDVPGLRDSVRNGQNGILIANGDYRAMGRKLVDLITSRLRPTSFSSAAQEIHLTELSESSLTFIKNFGWWDERYREFKKIITND